MRILIDSREQAPFIFASYEVKPEVAALPIGDYSLPGFTDKVAIERKELNDLISCLMNGNRDRFERELAKTRHFDLFAVVVQAPLSAVSRPRKDQSAWSWQAHVRNDPGSHSLNRKSGHSVLFSQ